mmetsp:Transcript_142886/g.444365  ORF Transcript_142886/g.444365 Transcript_142886/m.444365 type:complete len:351 (-) Transcript_142886:150-1202(-)
MPPPAAQSGPGEGQSAAEVRGDEAVGCKAADGITADGRDAIEEEAPQSKPADGSLADDKGVDCKNTGGVAADGKADSPSVESGSAANLILADGTPVLAPTEPASAAARTAALCAAGEAFAAAPRKRRAVDAGAALAQEYFGPAAADPETLPGAHQGSGPVRGACFAPELLERAPGSVQTCRSLLQFLEKKLEAPPPKAPDAGGPKDLRQLLIDQADRAGRLAAFKEGGWDARARRILDVAPALSSGPGAEELAAVGQRAADAEADLEEELKERGEASLNSLIKERAAWAKECVRREWFGWCARLLRAREASLLAASKAAVVVPPRKATSHGAIDALAIARSLLRGTASAS